MYLGLDLGTSGVKAVLIDDNQRIIATGHGDLTVSRPQRGWSEQSPADWITASITAIDAIKTQEAKALSAVSGIGLAGHMHGATLLDSNDEPLRPCILWNDTRSAKEAAMLDTARSRQITGNILFPGFTAPKLVWAARHERENFANVAKVLLPKDYLRLWLTGEYVSEMSDASGTGWLDVAARCWSDELLDAGQLKREQMPSLVEGTAVSGQIRSDLAEKLGLNPKAIVAGGAGDNAASACGMGTVMSGAAFLSLGTSGVLFAANDNFSPNPELAVHAFCHAVPATWHQMGVILSATDSLNWLSGILDQSPETLTAALGDTPEKPSGIQFLPYLGGERTPHNDAETRGAFINLDHGTDTSAMTQAVLEGVSFAFRDSLNALGEAGTVLDHVTAIGGGSKSDYWLKLVATVLGIPVSQTVDGDFGAGFGAARLGMIAATGSSIESVCTQPEVHRTFEPVDELQDAYQQAYGHYRALYPALKALSSQ